MVKGELLCLYKRREVEGLFHNCSNYGANTWHSRHAWLLCGCSRNRELYLNLFFHWPNLALVRKARLEFDAVDITHPGDQTFSLNASGTKCWTFLMYVATLLIHSPISVEMEETLLFVSFKSALLGTILLPPIQIPGNILQHLFCSLSSWRPKKI